MTTNVTVTLTFNSLTEDELRQKVHEVDAYNCGSTADAITSDNVSPIDIMHLWAFGEIDADDTSAISWTQPQPQPQPQPTDADLARINAPDYVIAALMEWLHTNDATDGGYKDVHQWVWGNSDYK